MASISKITGAVVTTPTKGKNNSGSNQSRLNENFDPNVLKFSRSPSMIKSAKKSASRKPNCTPVASPPAKKKIRERKFVIAKKKSRKEEVDSSSAAVACEKCRDASPKSKCLCVAYETLRASQEEFFRNRAELDNEIGDLSEIVNDLCESNEENGELGLKRSRDRLLEEARESVPEAGSGRVRHLVEAFEKLKMMPKSGSEEQEVEEGEDDKKGIKWALPGLQQPTKASETGDCSSSFCSSDFFLTSKSLGLDSRRSSSDSSQGSISTRTCSSGRKNRRSSNESSGTLNRRQWKRKQQKATSQKPFNLRTEQRGRYKEEEFMKKLQQMVEEEEKMRIPVAQGLPWTTDQPECLVKPAVKDKTRPVDLVLHSDERAVERAEFDDQVAKKMDLIEQYRAEKDRQQKLAEEEEIKRLRKVLVPKAQPMPYFDRPFVPRRSTKNPTVPKEPKFQLPQQKKIKCNLSLDDQNSIHNWSE